MTNRKAKAIVVGMFTNDLDPQLLSVIAAAAGRSTLASTARAAKSAPTLEQATQSPRYTAAEANSLTEAVRAHWDRELATGGALSPARPNTVAAAHADIVARWKADEKIRAEFQHFGAYAEFKKAEFCRQNGMRRDEFDAAGHADADAYIAGLERHGSVNEKDKADIRASAAQWIASEDLRKEFGSFAVFASFSRAKANGRARVLGR